MGSDQRGGSRLAAAGCFITLWAAGQKAGDEQDGEYPVAGAKYHSFKEPGKRHTSDLVRRSGAIDPV